MEGMTPDIWFPKLNIMIEHLDRVAFKLFGVEIYWYGILICIGMILAIALAMYEAKRTGQNPESYTDFVMWGVIAGIIGARTYYLVFHEGSLINFFAIRQGGLAIYGGVIGSLVAVIIYTKVKKINVLKFTDTCAMSLLVGQIVGRWGNFINREAFGSYTNNLLALRYKAEQVAGLVLNGDTAIYNGAEYPVELYNGIRYIQVHPTFLYESLWNAILLIILFCYRKHKKYEGELSAMYFIGYGIGRAWIESLRTDQLMIAGMPVSVLLSCLLVACGVVFEVVMRLRVSRNKM